MQRSGLHRQIVDELAAAPQQRRIFDAQHALTNIGLGATWTARQAESGDRRFIQHGSNGCIGPKPSPSGPAICLDMALTPPSGCGILLLYSLYKTSNQELSAVSWLVGVDVGGTFTDFFAYDATGTCHPFVQDPLDAPQSCSGDCRRLARDVPDLRIDAKGVSRLCHGTTVATNALIQRKGAKRRRHHHAWLSRLAGDRPPDAAAPLLVPDRPSGAAGPSPAAFRDRRTDHRRAQGS